MEDLTKYSIPGSMATSPSFEYGGSLKKMQMIQQYRAEKQQMVRVEAIIRELEQFRERGGGRVMDPARYEEIRAFMAAYKLGNEPLNDRAYKLLGITNSLLT